MRYAILSDIHGNLPAWNTVLSDLAVRKVDRILCLGDIVGYGPQPAECLKSVYSHAAAMLLGNHDAVVGGRMSAAVFNDRAQRVITWTQSRLGDKAQSLFAELPLVIKGPNFRCTHGDFVDPAMFRYVSTPEEAAESFAACPEQLLFCGHTHKAALYIIGHSGVVHEIPPQDFALEEGKRYLINVGSVGSPRDGDPRASYVIYDEERQAVFFIRVPFDFAAFRAAVAAAPGLRAEDVQLLRTAAVSEGASQVREEMDFEPNEAARVEGGAELEADLSRLKRTNRMLRTTVALLIAGGLAALVLGIVAVQTLLPHDVSLPAYSLPPITAVSILNSDGNALPALEPCYAKNDAVYCFPYRIFLDDRRVQSIGIDSEIFVPVDVSEFDDTGIIQKVGKTLFFEDEGEEETYKIVTTIRENSLEGRISNESPIGKAVMGHKAGDRVYVKVNDRFGYYVVIRAIEKTVDDSSDRIRSF